MISPYFPFTYFSIFPVYVRVFTIINNCSPSLILSINPSHFSIQFLSSTMIFFFLLSNRSHHRYDSSVTINTACTISTTLYGIVQLKSYLVYWSTKRQLRLCPHLYDSRSLQQSRQHIISIMYDLYCMK